MIGSVSRPFPLKPLAERLGSGAARRLRINGAAWKRLSERGSLSVGEADRFAVRAGFHPADVWGDLWFSADETPLEPAGTGDSEGDDRIIVTGRTIGCSLTNPARWPPLSEVV